MSKSFCLLFTWSCWMIGVLSAAVAKIPSVSWIVPGAVWYDTDGIKIDAHGGQVWKQGNMFYWIGSSYNSSYQPRIYTSTDLMNWVNRGVQYPIINMFRPKIFGGASNYSNKYYILGQISDAAQQLYSGTITRGYSKGDAYRIPPNNYTYTDEGVFEDDDGTWFFLTSAAHNNLQLNVINGDGTPGDRVSVLGGLAMEAPGMFKVDGVYYLILSAKTGYNTNPNKVYWSTSLSGPWTGPADIAPEGENTYGSQNSDELVIKGSSKTTYIYLGDAWDTNGTAAANYMWLPMIVDTLSHNVTLQYKPMWKVDVHTGEVCVPRTGKRYEAEHAEISGRAVVADCAHCISKRAVKNIDISSNVIFTEVHGTGEAQWVSFHYTTNNKHVGDAHICINNDTVTHKISDYNIRAGFHKTIPIRLNLNPGPVNIIKVGCTGHKGSNTPISPSCSITMHSSSHFLWTKDFEIHVDGIEVHED